MGKQSINKRLETIHSFGEILEEINDALEKIPKIEQVFEDEKTVGGIILLSRVVAHHELAIELLRRKCGVYEKTFVELYHLIKENSSLDFNSDLDKKIEEQIKNRQ